MTEFTETEVLQAMKDMEGFSFEEAKLSYAKRQTLPDSAFCGPKRSYPAHDAAHVRNALARLSQFGGRLKPSVRASILGCLKRRAKRFGVEISETSGGKLCLAKWDETIPEKERKKMLTEIEETVNWYREHQ